MNNKVTLGCVGHGLVNCHLFMWQPFNA